MQDAAGGRRTINIEVGALKSMLTWACSAGVIGRNPIANLVYCAHGGCADTVIVDGKVLMRGGKVLTLNETDLYEEAKDRARSLVKRAGLEKITASIWPME